MSRAVVYETFGGPDVLEVREVSDPHPGPGEVRVRVSSAGLNPMDWMLSSQPDLAAQFGVTVPSGFGSDFAGVIDEVGPDVTGFVAGDRVYGAAIGRAVADLVVLPVATATLWHTPAGLGDEIAGTLAVAGATAAAALAAVHVRSGDVVLVGGAAGGVGVFAVQMAVLAGATVLGTASQDTFDFLRHLGAEPVAYGPGLADRVRTLAPAGVDAAIDLFGTETVEAALSLDVPADRIAAIAAGPNPPGGVRPTGASDAAPDAVDRIALAVLAGEIAVPIAARFPVERIQDAVTLQAERHVHGKVVVGL